MSDSKPANSKTKAPSSGHYQQIIVTPGDTTSTKPSQVVRPYPVTMATGDTKVLPSGDQVENLREPLSGSDRSVKYFFYCKNYD